MPPNLPSPLRVLRDTIPGGWLQAQNVPDIATAVIARAAAMLDPSPGPARWNLSGNPFLRRRAGRFWVEQIPASLVNYGGFSIRSQRSIHNYFPSPSDLWAGDGRLS